VIYRGRRRLPGAQEALEDVRRRGLLIRFVTNNATLHREEFAARLRALGVPAEPGMVLTSAAATATWLSTRLARGSRLLVVGESGLLRELREEGFAVTHAGQIDQSGSSGFAAVVVGLDRSFTYDALAAAQAAVLAGALLVGTNGDLTFPAEGKLLPGGGSLLAAVQAATGQEPVIIGKPHAGLVDSLRISTGVGPAETLLVGDRLDTDIDFGLRSGMQTVLVLTGVTARGDLVEGVPLPDHVLEDLRQLPGLLDGLNPLQP
jgi:4-nitrophenyl phosphatase